MTKQKSTTQDHQKIADTIQNKLSGVDKKPKLYEDVDNPEERMKLLESEVKSWHEKFVAMEKTWHTLANATVGKDEADKLSKEL